MQETENKNKKKIVFIMLFISMLVIVSILVSYRYFRMGKSVEDSVQDNEYAHYFLMIVEDTQSPFWQSLYKSAQAEAKTKNAYIEMLGTDLPISYSTQQLMDIAIHQKVDGILIEPDKQKETTEKINEAVAAGIPVITMMEDAPLSARQCYIGVSNYSLGQEYVKQIQKIATEKMQNTLVLLPAGEDDASKNLIFSSIKEIADEENLKVESNTLQNADNFGTEETIRNIVLRRENVPDILICLNSVQTESAYQAIVNHNKVGEIKVIGYFETETILQAIEKGIIESTLAVDTVKLGQKSIEMLCEYMTNKRVSDYVTVDVNIIDRNNVMQFLKKEGDEENR